MTAQLQIPTGPFIQSASVMLLCAALMHVIVAVHALRNLPDGQESGGPGALT